MGLIEFLTVEIDFARVRRSDLVYNADEGGFTRTIRT